ncbi:AAA domain-containing protein [Heliophilum fasciatum]|uniref:AAA domain-containing protein n=1 Tax=Heliophilum fasciatum TaxID=35700 RepID=A0A4R2RIT9_9FIRM|nr:AAA domain-containing protein [Heliophilum fasciatum]MCW2278379.1 putative transcriptional regulator [Heliophilum fasciatum]TCP63722.1 AAA domain-containing protein [Heliophilum fasciatum]
MTTSADRIREFLHVIEEKITALKKSQNDSNIPLHHGRLVSQSSGRSIYQFSLENPYTLGDDIPGELEIGGNRYPCQTISCHIISEQNTGQKNDQNIDQKSGQCKGLHVALQGSLGHSIPVATLSMHPRHLWEMLHQKYINALSTPDQFAMSERVFQGASERLPALTAPTDTTDITNITDTINTTATTDADKAHALAHAVVAHAKQGRRILLVSRTHRSVDEAMETIVQHAEGKPLYQQGKLLRLGGLYPALGERFPLVLPEKIETQKTMLLIHKKRALQLELTAQKASLARYQKLFAYIEKQKSHQETVAHLQATIHDLVQSIDRAKAGLAAQQILIRERNRQMVDALNAGFFQRMFNKQNPDQLSEKIQIHQQTISEQEKVIAGFQQLRSFHQDQLDKAQAELTTCTDELKTLAATLGVDPDVALSVKEKKEQGIVVVDRAIQSLNQEIEAIRQHILDEAKLVATTMTNVVTDRLLEKSFFDVLIINEANRVPLPLIYWAASKATQAVTLVSDVSQWTDYRLCIPNKNRGDEIPPL